MLAAQNAANPSPPQPLCKLSRKGHPLRGISPDSLTGSADIRVTAELRRSCMGSASGTGGAADSSLSDRADLVVMEGDPTEDIAVAGRIMSVYRDGIRVTGRPGEAS